MTQRRIYQDKYPYFITFRTREGYQLFVDEKTTKLLSNIIFNAGRLKGYDILAYQIMPDHIHLLVGCLNGNAGVSARVWKGKRNYSAKTSRVSEPAMDPFLFACQPSFVSKKEPFTISNLIYTIKSYFIKRIRTDFNIRHSIWQRRFYVRIIDTDKYLRAVTNYIKYNPIKQDLPHKYHELPYQYFNNIEIENLF